MNELVNKLVTEAGLTADQANKTIDVIKGFVTDKFPMLAGAVDNVFAGGLPTVETAVEAVEEESGSWMDKISDLIPGEIGEKVESFAKKAADKAEDAADAVSDKAKELYEKGKDKYEDLTK